MESPTEAVARRQAGGYGFRARRFAPSRNDEREAHRARRLMYYVYLLASRKHGTLYLGVTNNLVRRVYEHKNKVLPGFTARYGITRLVWYECYDDPENAIAREKEIKK
jgi:putative endonuclease